MASERRAPPVLPGGPVGDRCGLRSLGVRGRVGLRSVAAWRPVAGHQSFPFSWGHTPWAQLRRAFLGFLPTQHLRVLSPRTPLGDPPNRGPGPVPCSGTPGGLAE